MEMTQIFYMEKDSQFWEIQVAGRYTTIRYGKIGRPGRKLAAKEHSTVYQTKQFAIRQVNGKIIQGFQDPNVVVPRAPMVKLLSKRSSVRLQRLQTLQRPSTLQSAKDHVRQSNLLMKRQRTQQQVPRLKQSDTLLVKKPDPSCSKDSMVESKPLWRKPPKKQSTIRRRARQVSRLCKREGSRQLSSIAAIRTGIKLESSLNKDTSQTISRQDTVSVGQGMTKDLSRRQILLSKKNSTKLLPVLDKKRSSWDRPRISGDDFSMPSLSKETDQN